MKSEMLSLIALVVVLGCGGTSCPADQHWSECANASCEDCADCVGACVEGSGGEAAQNQPSPAEPSARVSCGNLTCGVGERCDDCGSDPSCPQCDVCVPTCVGSSAPEGSGRPNDGHDCPPGEAWDECAQSSCELCADCIGACVSRVSVEERARPPRVQLRRLPAWVDRQGGRPSAPATAPRELSNLAA